MAHTHYEVMVNFFEPYIRKLEPAWKNAKRSTGLRPGIPNKDFYKRFQAAVQYFFTTTLKESVNQSMSFLNTNYTFSTIPWIIFDDIYDHYIQTEDPKIGSSFVSFSHSDPFVFLISSLIGVFSGGAPPDHPVFNDMRGAMFASLISRFHIRAVQHYGDKVYEVSPDLQWALMPENTRIKNFPAEMLRLPFPAIYIALPSVFKIYNDLTNWHDAEGVYISEDTLRSPRAWRIVMVAGKNKESGDFPYDDAIYHWTMLLEDGKTIDECLKHSSAVALGDRSGGQVVTTSKGDIKIVDSVSPQQTRMWEIMHEQSVSAFRYIMNVVLYATSIESDQMLKYASAEYRKLRERAMKAQGKKRRKLFDRLKERKDNQQHILLGGSYTIDRKKEEIGETVEGTGHKHKVRYLVSGHWRSQPYGEGRKLRKPLWIKPHWRGPELAPVTSKVRNLK